MNETACPRVPHSLLALFALAAIAGCGSTPPPDLPRLAPPRAGDSAAYAAAKSTIQPAIHSTWTLRGEDIDVTVVAPAGAGPFPLVIYLPGLGESSAAGAAWRNAWAAAGYAVISAQPHATGASVWATERARVFDFRTVAREHFSPKSVPARVALVDALLADIARRQRAGEAGLGGIDASRVAIAGYDVGALAAMGVAGQSFPEQAATTAPAAVRAVIALSPYADFAGMGTEARFRTIRLPVLSVTSPDDTDAYGLVTTAAVRRAPFQYMPPGRKYLLLLGAGPHTLLGGQERPGPERDEARGSALRDTPFDSNDRGARTSRTPGSRSQDPTEARLRAARPDASVAWATQLRNVQTVSTAFLDAMLKEEPRAENWLQRDAERWLAGSASLQSK